MKPQKLSLFHIYTENVDKEAIEAIVSDGFASFSIFKGTSYWKGNSESLLCIEIIAPSGRRDAVHAIANHVKRHNLQESVIVMEHDVSVTFI